MIYDLFGVIGAFLIAFSWVPETIRTLKTKSTGLEIRFITIYLVGSVMLASYSIYINDGVFIFLNILASLLAVVNFGYTLKEQFYSANKKAHKKMKKRK